MGKNRISASELINEATKTKFYVSLYYKNGEEGDQSMLTMTLKYKIVKEITYYKCHTFVVNSLLPHQFLDKM